MVAPSTSATMPVPIPTRTPQSATSSHTCVIAIEATKPAMIIATAATTTGRTPKRVMKAAANGAMPVSIWRTTWPLPASTSASLFSHTSGMAM